MADAATKKWYLVYCKPRQEDVAKINLGRQGFETYLPKIRQPRRRLNRRVTVVEPMFPRYLFIHLDSRHDNWGPIRSTLGVTSLVRFGQYPAPVPDPLIAALRAREDEQGIQDLPPPDYKHGDRLRVADGIMMGCEGLFLARTGRDRVIVLLDIMGRQARVELAQGFVEPVR
ncbi:MAG: transcription/translation regulatory transformer protein RfaH [Acidiferrobacterales bacterium]